MALPSLSGRTTRGSLMGCQLAIVFVFAFAACIELCNAAAVVDVYRMFQYDLAGSPKGSRRAGFHNHVSSGLELPGSDLGRAVIVMPVNSVDNELLGDVLQNKRFVGGLLFLLPRRYKSRSSAQNSNDADSDEDDHSIGELEARLLQSNVSTPVYFAVENEELKGVLKEVKANDEAGVPAAATRGGYRLVVASYPPKALPAPTIVNIQAWLRGARSTGSSGILPTIAIVASYDTFGVAPGLSVGANSNGSGVAVLLELARLFAKLYSRATTHSSYNLVFVLTSGGPYNFDGTRQWLSSSDLHVLETVEFALCLDSLGAWTKEGGGLKLHISRPPKEPAVEQLYEAFKSVASEMDIPFELVHKKVNLADPRVYWEHEQFSRRRIVAGTLSGNSAPPPEPLAERGGLTDTRSKVYTEAVVKAVKLVGEALARHIYNLQGKSVDVFADNSSLAVNPPLLGHWLNLLASTPRVAPYLPKNAPIISALQKFLADQTPEVTSQAAPLEGDYTFYSVPTAQLSVYKVAGITFDMLLLVVVASYLVCLFCILHITTKGLDDFLGVFRKPPPRKNSLKSQ